MITIKKKIVKFANGKKLGVVCKDGVFRSFKKESKHLFKIYDGWGMNLNLLKELKEIGIEYIEIIATDTNVIYRTHIDNFFSNGILYRNQKGEMDTQLILPKRFWQILPYKKKLEYDERLNKFLQHE